MLRRTESSGHVSKWLLFFLFLKGAGIFFRSPHWEPGRISGGKSQESVESLLRLGLFWVFNCQTCPHWAPRNSSIIVENVPTDPGSSCGLQLRILCIRLSLQFPDKQFVLWPQFSDGSKKSCWLYFVQPFSFCEERLPSSAGPDWDQKSYLSYWFVGALCILGKSVLCLDIRWPFFPILSFIF